MAENIDENENGVKLKDELLQCFNYGCNQKYKESENTIDKCVYHSGEPYFHDAYKEWTCCHQKSTDFSTFLSFKGCKTGFHSNITKKVEKEDKKEIVEEKVEQKVEQKSDENEIEFKFDENLIKDLELRETKNVLKEEINENLNQNSSGNNIFCKRCRKSGQNINDVNEECVYHSGQVIFHDSLKYWTCCSKKKFSDFKDFEDLKGCEKSAKHELELRVPKPRQDWFQTNQNVSIILYGLKGCRALKGTKVQSNGRMVWVVFCNSKGDVIYKNEFNLKEFILVENSFVLIDKNKVEIQFEKVVKNQYWNSLT